MHENQGSLVNIVFAPDAQNVAYFLSVYGSAFIELHIVDINTPKKLPEVLEGMMKDSKVVWTKDGKSFFYAVSCSSLLRKQ